MKINASIFAIIVSAFVMNGCGHVDDDNVDPFPPNDVSKDSTNAHPQETYIINHPVPFSPESAEAKALLGKWKAVKDGLGDLKKQNLFLEFGNDGILSYETHVGFEDHTLVISNYGFKEDWTYNETLGALEGTLLCTLINRDNHEHDSYYCFVTNDLLVLYYGGIQNVPNHISLMDPATYYERIKRNKYNKAMKKIQFKVLSLIKMRKILFLTCFLAGMLVACDSDDEQITVKYQLQNEKGEECYDFQEGDNIIFRLELRNDGDEDVRFHPQSLSEIIGSDAFRIYSENGKDIGTPWDEMFSDEVMGFGIGAHSSYIVVCPWFDVPALSSRTEGFYSDLFLKKTEKTPLPKGDYYSNFDIKLNQKKVTCFQSFKIH